MAIAGQSYRELIDEVLAFQFAPGKYETLVKRWLNTAQRLTVTESEIRTQQETASYSTVAGDATLELPANFGREIDVHDEGGDHKLDQIGLRELDELPEESGRPVEYAVEGDEIRLYPTPDGAYELRLRYWRLPADMAADADEPEIPKQHHHRLVAYPMWKAYLRENDYAAASVWKAEWEAALLKMRGEVQSDAFDGPRQVPGSYANPSVIGG
jgi:hypothetical protein